MKPFEISTDELGKELAARFPEAQSWWDVSDLFPIFFVDFDCKHACGFYPEGTRMERYVPDGWTGEFEDFMTKFPEDRFPRREKYWVRNGVDMLHELNERGRKAGDNVRIYAHICRVTSVRLGVVVAANQSQGPNGGHDGKHRRGQRDGQYSERDPNR
jgi:hypothetical protein